MALSVFFHKFQKEKIVGKQMKSLISIYFQHLIKQTFKIRSIAKGSKFSLSDISNYMGHRMEQNLGKVKLIKRFMQLLSQMDVPWKYLMMTTELKTDIKGVRV